MHTLQVRDLPKEIYRRFSNLARKENRSITQQTIVLLQDSLGVGKDNKERRKALLAKLRDRGVKPRKNGLNPTRLLRADRDR